MKLVDDFAEFHFYESNFNKIIVRLGTKIQNLTIRKFILVSGGWRFSIRGQILKINKLINFLSFEVIGIALKYTKISTLLLTCRCTCYSSSIS